MFISLKRIIKAGLLNFRRQDGLIFATVSIMVMTISLITFLFLFQGIVQHLILDLQEKVDVSVYFKKDSLEGEILGIREEISKIPEVKSIEYVSKEEALDRFTQRHKDDPLLMEALAEVGDNPLLASLNIKAWQANQYEALANFLEGSSFDNSIEKIDFHKNKAVIGKIFEVSSNIRLAGIIFSLLLGIIAIVIAFNTTRLAIYNSKDEIAIMRLVGASNWFIRGPFLVQGIIVGIIATVITVLLFASGTFFLGTKLETLLPGFNLFSYFLNNFWALLLIQLIAGVGLSIISSAIAIRKHLKV